MTLYHEAAGEQVETTIPLLTAKPGEPTLWQKKIRTFLDACKNGTAAPVPIDQIIYNQAIIDGIARSSDLGREVKIEIPEL
jgi:predicted dehydrogenase